MRPISALRERGVARCLVGLGRTCRGDSVATHSKNDHRPDGALIIKRLIYLLYFGGAKRDRTADLLNAIQALSQLSYGPTGGAILPDRPRYLCKPRSQCKRENAPGCTRVRRRRRRLQHPTARRTKRYRRLRPQADRHRPRPRHRPRRAGHHPFRYLRRAAWP